MKKKITVLHNGSDAIAENLLQRMLSPKFDVEIITFDDFQLIKGESNVDAYYLHFVDFSNETSKENEIFNELEKTGVPVCASELTDTEKNNMNIFLFMDYPQLVEKIKQYIG